MGSLNRTEILGTMGADPDVKQLQGGNKVAQFTLATNDPAHKLQNGTEVPEKTEWHNIVCWGNLATIAERFLRKGAQVYVDGKLRTRSYEDKQGVKRYTTEIVANNIVLLNNGRNSQQSAQQPASGATAQPAPQSTTQAAQSGSYGAKDDDLPF